MPSALFCILMILDGIFLLEGVESTFNWILNGILWKFFRFEFNIKFVLNIYNELTSEFLFRLFQAYIWNNYI